MPQWLFEQMSTENPSWNPILARLQTINWPRALAFEIVEEHGSNIQEQFNSCLSVFNPLNPRRSSVQNKAIFGPLFHSLTFAVSLASFVNRSSCGPWIMATAIISWYYSVYNSIRAILAAYDGREPTTHAAVTKSLNVVRQSLPHPINMLSRRRSGETYDSTLPNAPSATAYLIINAFRNSRSDAQGMLISYLNGTAKWEADKTKRRLIRDGTVTDFRSQSNRNIRDTLLEDEINFMNCAFRYRTKANYRDSMYLAYGSINETHEQEFVRALKVVACFMFSCSVAYAMRRIGDELTTTFLNDVRNNFRGKTGANSDEMFFEQISI